MIYTFILLGNGGAALNLRIRILAASTAMVLVSLTVLLLVGGGVIGSFSRGDRTETVALDVELFETAALLNGFNGDAEALSSALERRGFRGAVIDAIDEIENK